METYIQALNYAIPGFFLLILVEFLVGLAMGVRTIRSMDTISSLSSGLSNVLKDVIRLTFLVVTYTWLYEHFALFNIKATWILVVIAFIGKDFAGYWHHRIEHKVNVFWNRHVIHHSSEEFNLACALRQTISHFTSIFVIFYLPIAIMGVPPAIVAIVAPIHLFAQFWYHTTLIKRMGWLEYIIVTPSHHRVHHAINEEYLDKNFSQIFIIWDKLFGTFQEEMDDVPPVYGITRPASTWNPFIINFQHIWLIAQDAWRTKNLWDKIRVWFMPTGWRPDDVKKKYPVDAITDVYALEKYDTKASISFQLWSWAQLVIHLGLVLYIFNRMSAYPPDNLGQQLPSATVLLYVGFVVLSMFSYTTLMDRNMHAAWLELLKFCAGISLIIYMGDWFGLDEFITYGTGMIVGYLVVSLVVTWVYIFWDIRLEKRQVALG
jgi:sterol desaturase/sphingolipid hydroxylase (fatty acid hydroxylase superfamily)